MKQIIVLFAFIFSIPALSGPLTMEQEAFLTFESLCITNSEHLERIPQLLNFGRTIEVEKNQAKEMLAPHTGRAFVMKGESANLLIMLTDAPSCLLYAKDADGTTTENLFREHSRNQLLTRETVGSELHSTYAVSYPADAGVIHALVFVDRPDVIGVSGISFGLASEQFLRAHGLKTPTWP